MISEKLQEALNVQVMKEWWSAGIYKAMAAHFEAEDMPGFANWFRVQALEELTHGDRIFNYICEVGGRARVLAIDEPKSEYSSAIDAISYGLDHEKQVTAMINNLMDMAKAENDHAAQIMLQWFVSEQVEEESSFSLLLKKVKMVEGDGRGMLMLDQELAARAFTPPAP